MRIFLDENLSEYVAEALSLLNKGYFQNIEVVSTKQVAELGIGKIVVFIKLPKGSDRLWDLVRLLIKHWEEVVEIVTSQKPRSMRLSPVHGIEFL